MVTGAYPTIPLDIIEVTWLVKYPERMVLTSELIELRALALVKHVKQIEEM